MPTEDLRQKLELELLRLRDQAIGLRAETMEAHFNLAISRRELDSIRGLLQDKDALLRENMTRAYVAESQVYELRGELDRLRQETHDHVQALMSSKTWRLGYALTAPARALRRIFS